MIYLAVKNEHDARIFQEDLDKLTRPMWKKRWMMEFHPDKCEVITISRKRNPVQYPYTLNSHQLKHVDVHQVPWCPDISRLALGQAYQLYHIQGQLHSILPLDHMIIELMLLVGQEGGIDYRQMSEMHVSKSMMIENEKYMY